MAGFRLYYNLNKHAPDQDSNLARIRADAANGPLTRVNIYGIVSMYEKVKQNRKASSSPRLHFTIGPHS
jgi:hypothetical protein